MLIGIDASRAAVARRTGTEAYAWHLIQSLIPLANQQGHTVRLYYNQPAQSVISQFPHDVVNIPFPRLWTHVRLAAELHHRPPDVFFTPAHVIPFTYFRPSVATVHDLGYHYFPAAHTEEQVRYLILSTRHNARRGRRVIVDSAATRTDLVKHYNIPTSKIEVVYPGRDPLLRPIRQRSELASVREKYGIQGSYLLFLSTIQPRKNVGRIVRAFANVAQQIPHQLVLAGKVGWLADGVKSQVEKLPQAVRERIVWAGFIDDGDKATLLSAADMLLYPSLYEGFGFPVLEAQACGTPVLTADNSSLPEVAGDAALQVSAESISAIADGILTLIHNVKLRDELIARGLENVKRFNWQTAAQQTLATLEAAAQ